MPHLVFISQTTPSYDWTTNLVAAYKLNSNGNDYTGNHNATPNGMTYSAGKLGDAADFDGSTSFFTVAHDLELNPTDGSGNDTAFTWTAWVYFNSFSKQHIMSKFASISNLQWIWYTENDGNLYFQIYSNNTTGNFIRVAIDTADLSTGTWYRFVYTYDGSEAGSGLTLYINGSFVGTGSTSGTYTGCANGTATLYIGRRSDGSFDFGGSLDQIQLYKGREWTDSEVAADYSIQNGGTDTLP